MFSSSNIASSEKDSLGYVLFALILSTSGFSVFQYIRRCFEKRMSRRDGKLSTYRKACKRILHHGKDSFGDNPCFYNKRQSSEELLRLAIRKLGYNNVLSIGQIAEISLRCKDSAGPVVLTLPSTDIRMVPIPTKGYITNTTTTAVPTVL